MTAPATTTRAAPRPEPPIRRVELVLLARPRGFCAGVEMAIKALAWMVRLFDPPVYCYHEIVHNRLVVERFRRLGVVFVDDVAEVPPGAPLMLSAHGTAPDVAASARARGGVVIDAVCPLVAKVHHEVRKRAGKGYAIVYVGHEGHDEAVGTMALAPEAIHLVEEPGDVADLPDLPGQGRPVALLTQTTLSQHDLAGVLEAARQRFPDLWMPSRSDLCFATTNRQDALVEVARRADAVVAIGSPNSSNTRALARVARSVGCRRVVRVDTVAEVPHDLGGVVGVTAGASAPEELVRSVVDRLDPRRGVEEVVGADEDEYFPLPRELRDLLRLLATRLSPPPAGAELATALLARDRAVAASDVLDSLDVLAAPRAPGSEPTGRGGDRP